MPRQRLSRTAPGLRWVIEHANLIVPEASMIRTIAVIAGVALATGAAVAHHGWGSYDAAKPVTVAGPIQTSKFENPHATVTVRSEGKVWTVTLAPTSRMSTRGVNEKAIAVGKSISAYG